MERGDYAVGLSVLGVVAAGLLGSSRPEPRAPRPELHAPAQATSTSSCRRDHAVAADECGACHSEIYAQWRQSQHAEAFDDPIFRAEYDPSPSRFCFDCHAAGAARHGHAPRDGVDCSGCHPPQPDGVATSDASDGVSMCAGCHQFDFPASPLSHGSYDPADPLQDTVHEWSASRAASQGLGCVDCHMPPSSADEPRSHRLLDTHDAELLARAVRVRAHAHDEPGAIVLDLRLTPGRVGHRVPTGDMFRRLRVTAQAPGFPPRHQWLGRFFAQAAASSGEGFRLRPVLDDRVPASDTEEALELRLTLPVGDRDPTADDRPRSVRWSVDLFRMPPEHARSRGLDEAMIRAPMAAGTVVVEPRPAESRTAPRN